MREWKRTDTELPEEGVVVDTKIDDANGCRNEARLMRRGRLWFLEDESMYVYYVPTHFREAANA